MSVFWCIEHFGNRHYLDPARQKWTRWHLPSDIPICVRQMDLPPSLTFVCSALEVEVSYWNGI